MRFILVRTSSKPFLIKTVENVTRNENIIRDNEIWNIHEISNQALEWKFWDFWISMRIPDYGRIGLVLAEHKTQKNKR